MGLALGDFSAGVGASTFGAGGGALVFGGAGGGWSGGISMVWLRDVTKASAAANRAHAAMREAKCPFICSVFSSMAGFHSLIVVFPFLVSIRPFTAPAGHPG